MTSKPKTYQVPKDSHPWRQYKDRIDKNGEATDQEAVKKEGTPVRVFITEIVESWSVVEVYTKAYGKEDVFKLNELPQYKQAAWLANMLKKKYGD